MKTNGNTKEAPRTREGLTLLGGAKRVAPKDYDPAILECFSNRHPELDSMVTLRCPEFTTLCPITGQPDFGELTLRCPEFTTLCPITGQPDFGELVVRYVPAAKLVESKSLKLYLFSFRNHGDFHEDVCAVVLKDLRALLAPKYIEVRGRFRPRGGIAIHPFVAWGAAKGGWADFAKERLLDEDVEIADV